MGKLFNKLVDKATEGEQRNYELALERQARDMYTEEINRQNAPIEE